MVACSLKAVALPGNTTVTHGRAHRSVTAPRYDSRMSPIDSPRSKARTCVELFAGAGGLAMSVHAAGFRPLLVNEFAKRACETLRANGAVDRGDDLSVPDPGGPWPLVEGDVRQVKFEYLAEAGVDVLAGGPPCQPFSLGGAHKGVEDERNMFPQMFRAIREMRPKAVICENVRGLLRPSFKPYFDYILRELELPFLERAEDASWDQHDAILKRAVAGSRSVADERYDVYLTPVNAADFGVPQIRQRVIIVAFRSDLRVDWDSFRPRPRYSGEALWASMRDGSYWDRHKVPSRVRRRVMRELPDAPLVEDGLKPWRTLRDAIQGIDDNTGKPLPSIPAKSLDRTEYHHGGFTEHIGWPDARKYTGHTPNLLDRPAKTVKAGVHGVPGGESVMELDDPEYDGKGYRYMTVRETARVMTFPDDWTLAGPRGEKMRQLGNAVPVRLGHVFAKAVARALDAADAREWSSNGRTARN